MLKKNLSLTIGIAIPILMIILVVSSIKLPNFFSQPKYNFLYATGGECYCSQYNQQYSVQQGTLIKNRTAILKNIDCDLPQNSGKLFIHNTVNNTNRQIAFVEAQQLNLDAANTSPDGFTITQAGKHGSLFAELFYANSSRYNDYILEGHFITKKVEINLLEPCRSFRFIAWIKN